MSLKCPECGSDNLYTERRMNGESRCNECGYRDLTSEFERHGEVPTYKDLEAKLKVAVEALELIYVDSFGAKELAGLSYEEAKAVVRQDNDMARVALEKIKAK